MMKAYKRVLAALLAVVLLAVWMPLGAFADQTMAQSGDVVLVMDDTGSMRWNDPNFVASAAVTQMGVKTPKNGSSVGVVTFSTEVMAKLPLMPMDDAAVAKLEQFAQNSITRSGDYTDLAVGLKEAVNMLAAAENKGGVQTIIAVTDGANDYGSGRTEAMSARDLAEVEQLAVEKGITIHLIGINQDENAVKAYLQGIASVTGGSAAFVSNVDDMTKEISRIYQDLGLLQHDGTSVEHVGAAGLDKVLTVPENTFEAVVTITHPSPIKVTITAPDGSVLDEKDPADNLYITNYTTQTAFKLWEPVAGSYNVHIENVNVTEQDVEISTYLNSEFRVEVSCTPATVEAGKKVTVSAALLRGADAYGNADLQHLTGEVSFANGTDRITEPMKLEGDRFTAEVKLPAEGDWQVTATLRGSRTFACTSTVTLAVTAAAAPLQPEQFPWWILLVVLAVLVIAVLAVSKARYNAKMSKLPRKTMAVQLMNRGGVLWTVMVTPRATFSTGAALRNGVSLMALLKHYNEKTVSQVPVTGEYQAMYEKVLVKPDLTGEKAKFVWTYTTPAGITNTANLQERPVVLPLDQQNGISLRLQWR